MKEQDTTSGKTKTKTQNLNEMEISHLPDEFFKVTVIKMLTELGGGMDELSETFNTENMSISYRLVNQVDFIPTHK